MNKTGIGPATDQYLAEGILYSQDWTDPLEHWLDRAELEEKQ